jgi:hypothetical protein
MPTHRSVSSQNRTCTFPRIRLKQALNEQPGAGVGGQVVDVGDPADADQLEREQGQQVVDGRDDGGALVAGGGDQARQVEGDQLGHGQRQPGQLRLAAGGQALRRAVKDVFGEQALVQRCRIHKERGVLDHLPEREHGWVRGKLRRAWANPDADEATRDLEALARQLEKLNPDAAGSLREGLAEMFTVTRLGVTGALLRTVASTNPVESMIEIVRDRARNVRRWKDGDMRLR